MTSQYNVGYIVGKQNNAGRLKRSMHAINCHPFAHCRFDNGHLMVVENRLERRGGILPTGKVLTHTQRDYIVINDQQAQQSPITSQTCHKTHENAIHSNVKIPHLELKWQFIAKSVRIFHLHTQSTRC